MIAKNWPVLPLGWQISDDALSAMRQSIKDQRGAMDDVLAPFGRITLHYSVAEKVLPANQ